MSIESLQAEVKAAQESPRTLAEKAFGHLHAAIIRGALEPGERLLIRDLARSLDVSPMPIREALRRLDAVGLVETVPHKGTRVTELSAEDLIDVHQSRLRLETLAIQRAAERFTAADELAAREALQAHREAVARGDAKEVSLTHAELHFSLYQASRSRWMPRLIRPLWESSERYLLAFGPVRSSLRDRIEEHDLILDACVRHEPAEAARELQDHLATTANALAEAMGEDPPFELSQGLLQHAVGD